MRIKSFYALFLLAGFTFGFSLATARAEFVQGANMELSSGYRRAQLDWNIAGNSSGSNPDVLSELDWEDLDIFQMEAEGSLLFGITKTPHLLLCVKGSAAYGWIVHGDNRDSDYAGDHRTLEFSRSENDGSGGNVLDLSIAAGPQFHLLEDRLAITLLAGLSYHEQNLEITDGRQTVSVGGSVPPIGPFPGLDSSYDTQWRGPWLGTDLAYQINDRCSARSSFEYHFAEFEAEANWNLRGDLAHPVSFRHDDHGRGIVVSAGIDYLFTSRWSMNLAYTFQDWQTDNGTHVTYPAAGGAAGTRLNEVHWQSHAVMVGIGYRF